MIRKISVGEIAEFVFNNRKGQAFSGDSFETILTGIYEDVQSNNLRYYLNDKEELVGVVNIRCDVSHKILIVRNIIITQHAALIAFMYQFKKEFSGWSIKAQRRAGKLIEYNTPRLQSLILNQNKTL